MLLTSVKSVALCPMAYLVAHQVLARTSRMAPHDLRRTCARLCQASGGELEQIQMLLGHVSIQTTERYLGSKQRIRLAVNDRIGIEPDSAKGSGRTQ